MAERQSLSKGVRFKIFERDKYTCQYCGSTIEDGIKLEIDHKIPVSKGGTNKFDNLVTACFDCNRGKRDFLNIKKINVNDITPEIANKFFPLIRDMYNAGIDNEKLEEENNNMLKIVSDNTLATSEKLQKAQNHREKSPNILKLEKNKKRICNFLGIIESNENCATSEFYGYYGTFREKYDEYYKKTHIQLKSTKQHLELFKQYHDIQTDQEAALMLIEISDQYIPLDFVQSIMSSN